MDSIEKKLAVLKDVRENNKKYLPVVDHVWDCFPARAESGETNVGWDVGILPGNRPYFAECWSESHTVMTYYISIKGIEDAKPEELEKMLADAGVINYTEPRKFKTSVRVYRDFSRNKFFSVNFITADEDGSFVNGGKYYDFDKFNELNRKSA